MSMRTIARSSSNRKSASDLASSVLPVPVGPRKRNEPVGRLGSEIPARERRTASLTARHGLLLPDQPLADDLLHPQQLGGLALEQPTGRDAGPGLDDVGDLLGADLLADQRLGLGLVGGLGRLDLLLERRDPAVEDLAGLLQLALASELVGLDAQLVELAAQLALTLERGLLLLPARVERRAAPPRGRRAPRCSASSRSSLASSVSFSSANSSIFSRSTWRRSWSISSGRGLDLHPQPRRRLVDEVDRLVGQLAAGDVAVGEGGRRDQGGVGDPDAVVRLVLLLDAAQDLDGVLDAGLADEDLLEAALQRRVLLDPLAVLVERGRADHVQLAAGQHRLEHVAGVHRRVATGARTDDRVQLVDEGDDLPAGVLDLLEHGLEPLLELAAVLRPGDHRGQVERQHAAALEGVGHVAGRRPAARGPRRRRSCRRRARR